MTAFPVVNHPDVIEHVLPGFLARAVSPAPDSFLFQVAEEGLRDRVIPTVAAPVHADLQLVLGAESLPIDAAVLPCRSVCARARRIPRWRRRGFGRATPMPCMPPPLGTRLREGDDRPYARAEQLLQADVFVRWGDLDQLRRAGDGQYSMMGELILIHSRFMRLKLARHRVIYCSDTSKS